MSEPSEVAMKAARKFVGPFDAGAYGCPWDRQIASCDHMGRVLAIARAFDAFVAEAVPVKGEGVLDHTHEVGGTMSRPSDSADNKPRRGFRIIAKSWLTEHCAPDNPTYDVAAQKIDSLGDLLEEMWDDGYDEGAWEYADQ